MSARRARTATVALALAGIGIAGYLTWVHYTGTRPVCTGIGDCARVQASEYARLGGVPVALVGLLGYVAILGAAMLPGTAARLAGIYLSFTGAGFSLYLTWVELVKIDAICQWCVASAAVMLALAAVAVLRRDLPPAGTHGRVSRARQERTRASATRRGARRARASR